MPELKHYPNLKTILMVEKFLSDNWGELFSKAAIIRGLGGRINNNTLSAALDYLEESNKIMQSSKGIFWTKADKKKTERLMKDAIVF